MPVPSQPPGRAPQDPELHPRARAAQRSSSRALLERPRKRGVVGMFTMGGVS